MTIRTRSLQETASFKLKAIQEQLSKSAPLSQLDAVNNEFTELALRYQALLHQCQVRNGLEIKRGREEGEGVGDFVRTFYCVMFK